MEAHALMASKPSNVSAFLAILVKGVRRISMTANPDLVRMVVNAGICALSVDFLLYKLTAMIGPGFKLGVFLSHGAKIPKTTMELGLRFAISLKLLRPHM